MIISFSERENVCQSLRASRLIRGKAGSLVLTQMQRVTKAQTLPRPKAQRQQHPAARAHSCPSPVPGPSPARVPAAAPAEH